MSCGGVTPWIGWLAVCQCLSGWLAGWLAGWLSVSVCLAVWLAVCQCLSGWLSVSVSGWLSGWLSVRLQHHRQNCNWWVTDREGDRRSMS